MSHEILGWIFVFLIAVYIWVAIKYTIIDKIKELKNIALNENQNGDGI